MPIKLFSLWHMWMGKSEVGKPKCNTQTLFSCT